MSASARSLVGSLLLASVIALAYGCLCIYTARRDIALAQNESSTTGQATLHPRSRNSSLFNPVRCDYTFIVDGSFYWGHGMCPEQTDHSLKGTLQNLAGILQNQTVTVYYDPANPGTNSLMEFGAKSEYDYRKAKLSFAGGVAFLLILAAGSLYFASLSKANRGIVVDSEGTVIYPDEIDSSQKEFAAHPELIGSEKEQTDRSTND
jgi:hypothetical protein